MERAWVRDCMNSGFGAKLRQTNMIPYAGNFALFQSFLRSNMGRTKKWHEPPRRVGHFYVLPTLRCHTVYL